jgi:predicted metal-dependent phosphoesterase TrpH
MRWLKAELHTHCNLDPQDHRFCDYTAEDLITRAARLGYDVLAITCHNVDVWHPALSQFAADQGITLIPGMEIITRERKHVLLYNFRAGTGQLDTLEKIRARKREDTLVVAPHPYYPAPSCLGRSLEQNLDLFDAIEHSGFFTRHLDFNRRACRIAAARGKPLLGNSDAHQLWQLGRTWTRILAEPEIDSIFSAVRAGRTRVQADPLSMAEVWRWHRAALRALMAKAERKPLALRPLRRDR